MDLLNNWGSVKNIHFNFARIEQSVVVVDNELEVPALVVHYDMIRISIMDDFVRFNAGYPCCVENTLVLGRAQRNQALNQNLKINFLIMEFF